MAQAAQPAPSAASRIAGMVGSGLESLVSLPFQIPQAIGGALQGHIDNFKALPQQRALALDRAQQANEAARLQNEAQQRQAQLEQAQLPAQQALAAAQARQQAELAQRIGAAPAGRERDALIRGAATGTFRPFELEPGPAELAAYQSVLGMKEDEARQRLMAQREQRQAELEARLSRETTAQRLTGELQLEKDKRALGPGPASIDDEKAMRSEFEGLSKEFSTVRQAYKTLNAVADTKAGDLTFLVQYMKMIDPGASVREGDLATADNAGGVPGSIVAFYNKFRGEAGRIDPNLRADFLAQAENLYQARLGSHRSIEKQYGEIALRRGIDPRNVVTDFVGPDLEKRAPRKTINGAEYEKVDGGWKLVEK